MQKIICLLGICCCLSACGFFNEGDGPPGYHVNIANIPNATPKVEPRSRYGNPKSYVVFGKRYYVMSSSHGYHARGIASWYGTKFHERRTSSGETYNMLAMTAAHKTLPLPTYVRVTNLENNRSVIVKVNDRGPFVANRLIDLSYVAAKKLGVIKTGTAMVDIRAINPRQYLSHERHEKNEAHTTKIVSKRQQVLQAPSHLHPVMYLQLGAYRDSRRAHELKKKLSYLTQYPIELIPVLMNHEKLYRVRVGPLPQVKIADYLARRFKQAQLPRAHIVVVEQRDSANSAR